MSRFQLFQEMWSVWGVSIWESCPPGSGLRAAVSQRGLGLAPQGHILPTRPPALFTYTDSLNNNSRQWTQRRCCCCRAWSRSLYQMTHPGSWSSLVFFYYYQSILKNISASEICFGLTRQSIISINLQRVCIDWLYIQANNANKLSGFRFSSMKISFLTLFYIMKS